jgi:hypothetical protein
VTLTLKRYSFPVIRDRPALSLILRISIKELLRSRSLPVEENTGLLTLGKTVDVPEMGCQLAPRQLRNRRVTPEKVKPQVTFSVARLHHV